MNDPGQTPASYWAATAAPLSPGIEGFEGNEQADVVIVGAGFTGLTTGLHLAERGVDVLVIDANEPGWGASGRNNGQVVAALKHEPHEIEEAFGTERGKKLIEAIGQAPDMVFGIIARYGIQCDAKRNGIITAAHSPNALLNLQKRTDVWRSRGAPLSMLPRNEMADRTGTTYYLGGSYDPRGGAINPLAYARGLAGAVLSAGGRLRSDARVTRIVRSGGRHILELAKGTISAGKIIIATNAYTDDLWPGLKKTFIPVRTPQLVSKPLPLGSLATILPSGEIMSDLRKLMFGVRIQPGNRLHLGGGGGTSGADREGSYRNMVRLCCQVFPFLPDMEWEYRWTGFMAMTPDFYPRLFELAPGIAACLGYSGRGIGTATLLGQELAKWASDTTRIDELVLPLSHYRELPYYPFKEILVETAIKYYDARDRLVHALSHGR
ncbi:NAD(P)/FAD-dependent oxidoreductase [Ferrovibrio xuzhouensis]|uniref:NAD(P)/FAD-dependent oxidoreductase n=1 Tax=Ferrovibrio xuzhouensis TaxID=1576914 RepID=A0ABV7VNU9_9PROT